eukprot:3056559-Amphidinium_carterae.1
MHGRCAPRHSAQNQLHLHYVHMYTDMHARMHADARTCPCGHKVIAKSPSGAWSRAMEVEHKATLNA